MVSDRGRGLLCLYVLYAHVALSVVDRRLWGTCGSGCTYPLYLECASGSGHVRRVGPSGRRRCQSLYVLKAARPLFWPLRISFCALLGCSAPSFFVQPSDKQPRLECRAHVFVLLPWSLVAALLCSVVGSLQQPDGSFIGSPTSPEVDTRFSYCALLSVTLLNRRSVLDLSAAGAFLASCTNFDGGYGCIPDAESHAGQIFCVLAALALLGTPTPPAAAQLCEWLASRQLPCGGLNGRPDKKEDVCYSWWVVASLSMLGRVGWIDATALQRFVLGCQDPDAGGVADRVGDLPDVFHTFFGLAALDLLGVGGLGGSGGGVDPVFALPRQVVARLPAARDLGWGEDGRAPESGSMAPTATAAVPPMPAA